MSKVLPEDTTVEGRPRYLCHTCGRPMLNPPITDGRSAASPGFMEDFDILVETQDAYRILGRHWDRPIKYSDMTNEEQEAVKTVRRRRVFCEC